MSKTDQFHAPVTTSTVDELAIEKALDRDIDKVSANLGVVSPLLVELQSVDKTVKIDVRPGDNIHDSVAIAKGFHCEPGQLELVLHGEYPLDATMSFFDAAVDDGASLSVRLIRRVTLARDDVLAD